MMEVWRDIVGFEGWYQVSNMGRVRSVVRVVPHIGNKGTLTNQRWESKILKPTTTKNGYKLVVLSKAGKFSYPTVHRLVATSFIPNPENKRVVNHKDGDKSNNSVENLEWCTSSENNAHAYAAGLRKRGRRSSKI